MANIVASLPIIHGACIQSACHFHMTLHFLGSVTSPQKQCMHKAAQQLIKKQAITTFEIKLDRIGHFQQGGILWLGCQAIPQKLSTLHHRLGAALETCTYVPEKRCFTPHVTLARQWTTAPDATLDVALGEMPDFSVLWQIDSVVLVESSIGDQGIHYQLVEKYPLS